MSGDNESELFAELIDGGSREHYQNAQLYDYEYRRRRADISFYRALAKRIAPQGGDILELGCGSGRVTIPLARDGHHVVAIDQSKPMLAALQRRVEASPKSVYDRITIREGELCTFSVKQKFPLIIAAFNVVEHLYTRVELAACLQRVKQHLAPGGVFAFDVQLPDLAWLIRDPNKRWAKTKFTDPVSGRKMLYSTNHEYDPISQIALIRIYYEPLDGSRGSVVKLSQRKFFPAELEALVAASGLVVSESYGDFNWQPLDGYALSQVLVCSVANSERQNAMTPSPTKLAARAQRRSKP